MYNAMMGVTRPLRPEVQPPRLTPFWDFVVTSTVLLTTPIIAAFAALGLLITLDSLDVVEGRAPNFHPPVIEEPDRLTEGYAVWDTTYLTFEDYAAGALQGYDLIYFDIIKGAK